VDPRQPPPCCTDDTTLDLIRLISSVTTPESSVSSLLVAKSHPLRYLDPRVRPVGYKKSVNSDLVSDVHGNALPGSLKLHLSDLSPRTELNHLHPGAPLDKGVAITYDKIMGYMREAKEERETVRHSPFTLPSANTSKGVSI
jgi:hypothetical protein